MTEYDLRPHPKTPPGAAFRLAAAARWTAAGVAVFEYRVTGAVAAIRMPPAAAATRADGLWRRTCFEAFIAAPGATAYCEFNFSPSGEWAAYRFRAYRDGMTELELAAAPSILVERNEAGLHLRAEIDLGAVIDADALAVALTAVIEETDGAVSYWSLAHPPGKPDFHHRDCFALTLTKE